MPGEGAAETATGAWEGFHAAIVQLLIEHGARQLRLDRGKDALHAAVCELRDRFGADTARWGWGRVRPLTLVHPFAKQPPMDRVFNVGPVPGRGDAGTVHQGSVDLADPAANVVGCPTLRAVIDVGAWENSRFVLLGGQSGNPTSPHYEDQVAMWAAGQGVPIYWRDDDLAAAAVARLELTPA